MSASESTPFPFSGQLVDGPKVLEWFRNGLAGAQSITICSAYLRSEALEKLCQVAPSRIDGRILVRWRLPDLVAGASDFDAFPLARSYGWDFYIRLDFHGKLYCLPPNGIIVGSANATLSGLGAAARSNAELCTLVESTPVNLAVVNGLFAGAVKVDNALYEQLLDTARRFSGAEAHEEWPADIVAMLDNDRNVQRLFVSECLLTSPNPPDARPELLTQGLRHDLALMGFSEETNSVPRPKDLREGLRQTAIYAWLVSVLRTSGNEAYFGSLAASLHAALLDDPAPSRVQVKSLLQNLLAWIIEVGNQEIRIDRPNHSQRVRYEGV